MIKDIVVSLSLDATHDPAAHYAVSLAEAFEAHVAGIAFAFEPVIAPAYMGSLPAEIVDTQRAANKRTAEAAVARFEQAAKRSGLSAEHRILSATLAGAADSFGRLARRFDLAVVGQGEPKTLAPQELLIEAALFESGRPVIIVPYIHKAPLKLDRVVVAWDGSRTATRAIADALPLLARAKAVEVLIVAGGRTKSDEVPGADVGQHLARHGLKVEVKRIVSTDVDVPNTILSHVADTSADVLVMGGYGHSRLREFVLGGATRGILNSMTVPVLMSH
jgi:nucleotide-binding universal stress UspA family protein